MTLNEPADLENPFDDIAAEYETWYSTALGAFVIASEQEALLAAISGEAGRLLDVGAGTGWWSRLLAGHGFEVTALEPSPAMRRVAATRTGSGAIEWVTGIGEDLPFSDGRFDVVLIMTVLEFAAEPERVLAEAWRVVRPGGRLVLGYLDALSPWAALYRRLGDRGVVPLATRPLHPVGGPGGVAGQTRGRELVAGLAGPRRDRAIRCSRPRRATRRKHRRVHGP